MKHFLRISVVWFLAIVVAVLLTVGCGGQAAQSSKLPVGTPVSALSGTMMTAKFLDVGEADSCILKITGGAQPFFALVDTGGIKGTSGQVVSELQTMGCTELNVMVLTHPDADHVGGATAVMDALPVDEVWDPGIDGSNSATWQGVKGKIASKGIPRKTPLAGETYGWNGVQTTVLNPPAGASYSETNDYSITLVESLGTKDIMLTGDAQTAAQQFMVGEDFPDIEVLKVPHHGANSGYYKPFFDKVHPQNSIISVGPNSYGHPSATVVSALEAFGTVYRTDEDGDVTVNATESSLQVYTGDDVPEPTPSWEPTSRTWGHDSVGTSAPAPTWYLAEGATAGDFETWVLVQNPGDTACNIDMDFMTENGQLQGPKESIPAHSRKSYNVGQWVTTYDVSTMVTATGGNVICERAMYGNGRQWAHESIGVTAPSIGWYFAEGCTEEGMETWILVQNPNAQAVDVILALGTSSGQLIPVNGQIPANSRRSFRLNDYITDYNVSTTVMPAGMPVVCERAMYGPGRIWAHDSIGAVQAAKDWYLAEGCTGEGFETWVLVQNPNNSPATVTLTYMTPSGELPGPMETLPANSRKSYNVARDVPDAWDVSTKVHADKPVVVERAIYGDAQ